MCYDSDIYNKVIMKSLTQTYHKAKAPSERSSFDLNVHLIPARGLSVDVLVESGVARYLQFKALEGAFFCEAHLEDVLKVPCSKTEVFKSKDLSVLEKRQLMKFFRYVWR